MSAFAPVTIGHASDVRELDDLEKQMAKLLTRAKEIEVRDDVGRDYAVEYLRTLKGVYKIIEAVCERFRAPAYEYYCQVRDEKKGILAPAEKAEGIIKGKLAAYRKECEEVAAELIREEMEKRRTVELAAQEEAYRAAIAAKETEKAVEIAVEMRETAPEIDTTGVAIEAGLITETKGLSFRVYWYADLIGPHTFGDLVKACAEGRAPMEFLTLNRSAVNAAAKKQKDAFNYPGLKSWSDQKVAMGG